MKSLQDFVSNDKESIFPEAKNLPGFFNHNLVDPARVIKVFKNDPQANIRIFYYQYLKLCFELDNVNYESYISKIEQIINNEGFKFIFYEDDDPSIFSDLQFKNLIMQFFGVLGDGNNTVDTALNRYPVMDTVLIYFFRAFLILTGKAQTLDSYVERDQLLQYLCSYFQVDITLHDKCIKFVQTDIFTYEQDPKEVFMAFMDYDKVHNLSSLQPSQQVGAPHKDHAPRLIETNKFDSKIQQPSPSPVYLHSRQLIAQNIGSQINANKVNNQSASRSINQLISNNIIQKSSMEAKKSYIASEFVDYTSVNIPNSIGFQQISSLKKPGQAIGLKQNQVSYSKKDSQAQSSEDNSKKKHIRPSAFETERNDNIVNQYKTNLNYGYASQAGKPDNKSSLSENLSSYMSKTHHSAEVPIKKIALQDNKQIPQQELQPTKDHVLTHNSHNQHISSAYEKPIIPSNSYQAYSKTILKQSEFYKNLEQKELNSQCLHVPESLRQHQTKKTTPQPNKPMPNYVPSYIPSYQSSYTSMYQVGMIQQKQYKDPTLSKPASAKNPFGLDVSLEFTNSFTMKVMNEPYRSNVCAIRQRARNFRNSLLSYIK